MFISRLARRIGAVLSVLILTVALLAGLLASTGAAAQLAGTALLPLPHNQATGSQFASIEPWDIHIDYNMLCRLYNFRSCHRSYNA